MRLSSDNAAQMDPMVKGLATLQTLLARSAGVVFAVGLAAVLIWRPSAALTVDSAEALVWQAAPIIALAGSLFWRLHRRYRSLGPSSPARIEMEIALQLAVLTYAAIELAAGSVRAPVHALAYLQVAIVAAFLVPRAVVASFTVSVALEYGLGWYKHGLPLGTVAVHVAFLAVFASVNLVMFRAEIARVRRLSRSKIDSELSRVSDAARNYRLNGAPRSAVQMAAAGAAAPEGDLERLMQSSVEHLELSLRYMLFLLRGALGLRTAALVWLSDDQKSVELREASSSEGELEAGPFSVEQGIFAACLAAGGPAVLEGARAKGCFPLYGDAGASDGQVCALPVREGKETVGMLLVHSDSEQKLDDGALQLISDAAAFAQRAIRNERLVVALETSKVEQGKLYYAVDQLAKARTEAEVIAAGVSSARQFAIFDFAAVTLFHAETRMHEICAVSGPMSEELTGQSFRHDGGLVSMVLANRHALPYKGVYNPAQQAVFDESIELPDMASLIVLPLYSHDTPLGTLMLGSRTPHVFGDRLLPTLEVLAQHISVSLAHARMVDKLEEQATTDGMTGLLNKRALIEVANQKIRSSARFKKPISLLVGDIDHFKKVNDTYGHDIGDVVIKGFGDVLRRCMRETDVAGRFGGEEFVVVCEQTGEEGATLLAERIRQELQASSFHTPRGPVSVTCSIGIASFPRAGEDWESLFKATDQALYVCKRGGRNQVAVWKSTMRGAA